MSFPEKIKAIQVPKHGDVDVIELAEVPFPKQQPGEVLIKVAYAGVNFIDTYMRKGLYPAKSFPFGIGQEASGTVVALPTDQSVLADEEFKKRGLTGSAKVIARYTGSFAEYISVPWKDVYSLPPSIPLRTGAALIIQGLTALTFMTEAHPIQKGETILIHTIAGGLGLFFLQIAKARGATVIGTTSSKEKAELAKKYGADHVILYTEEDTVKRVLEITGGEGVNAVFDGVGKDTFDANFELLRRKGSLVSVGNASGPVPPFPPLKLTGKNIKLTRPTLMNYIVTPSEISSYIQELYKLIESSSIKVNIFKEYPFTAEGVRQSQVDITGRSTIGKLLIKVSDE
ncbi:NAD-binding protein [Fomitiporia mediterranea MF3/22]|uniref:NAD-binding protein n=1 Tax=Fomitiporia mediterranea (strain MF3/22) TaxID=694068 RepID=UPI0004408758|nr:NAD-binding protein [Fomitiporia mediterranea MF3/22]EJC98614.1 NAD-binding protein [Fomitiporia mediterranea MF3/22]